MNDTVRVRFAPSPTGHLHIGGLRTALFNWLFARHNKGVFLIRIEDTDTKRSTKEFENSIFKALDWVCLQSDEPVLYQTNRFDIYKKLIDQLLAEGKAYRCYCPGNDDRIESDYYKYDGRCRLATTSDTKNESFVVRIKFPLDLKTITFDDLIRGPITFDSNQYDDFIIARSDGTPTYNFVVVVDDATTKISHVIRGEDHISNTPKQIILYNALGYTLPKFAHIPLILGSSGQRLSKRDAATSVLDYKNNGYLPDALCNYLVRLGWSHGDQEIFTSNELQQLFTLESVGKSGAIFDQNKLDWINGVYIRQTDAEALFCFIKRDIDSAFESELSLWDHDKIVKLIDVYKNRVSTLKELVNELKILYIKDNILSEEDKTKWLNEASIQRLKEIVQVLESIDQFTSETIASTVKQWGKENNCKIVEIAQPIRLALLGKTTSPGIFDIVATLGKKESIERLKYFLRI